MNKRKRYITLLRFIACIFITNSHCGGFYPMSMLAVGGSWGNSLFFIISGYCLAQTEEDFVPWIKKRYKRIIPPLLMIVVTDVVLTAFSGSLTPDNLTGYLNKYWFSFAMIIIYPLFYMLSTARGKENAIWLGLLAIYSVAFIFCVDRNYYSIEPAGLSWFKTLFYFLVMYTGLIIRRAECIDGNTCWSDHKRRIVLLIGCCTTLAVWCGFYWLFAIKGILLNFQFLTQWCILAFAVYSMFLGKNMDDNLDKINSKLWNVIDTISRATYEIYLVQIFVLGFIPEDKRGSLLLFWIAAIAGGVVFTHFINVVYKKTEVIHK